MTHVGGLGGARQLDDDEVSMIVALKDQIEQRCNKQFETFEPQVAKTQVVAGINYFAKVHVGNGECIHVTIYKPLPHTNEPPSVSDVQQGKTFDDELQ